MGARVLFGDKSWTDYDFTVQGQMVDRNCGFGLLIRDTGVNLQRMQQDGTIRHKDHLLFTVGAFGNTHHAIEQVRDAKQELLGKTSLEPAKRLRKAEWYTALVSVRGSRVQCRLDGDKIFDVNAKAPPAGLVGLMTWDAPFRFRNIKVTDPGGKVLLEGLPDLEKGQAENK